MRPEFFQSNGKSVVVPRISRIAAIAFLFIVDGGRLDDGLDRATLDTTVVRHVEVTDGRAHGDADPLAGLESRLFAERFLQKPD